MKGFIISNIRFNDKNIANEMGLSVEAYNKMLIDKWNSVVAAENEVFVYGVFGIGLRREMREIISQLKGKIYIMEGKANKFTKEEFLSFGVIRCWNIGLKYCKSDNDELFCTNKIDGLTCKLGTKDCKEVFKDNILSIEAKYWDYTPVRIEELPNIVNRLRKFEAMEEI